MTKFYENDQEKLKYLDFTNSTQAIAYLVSSIEKVNYVVAKYELLAYYPYVYGYNFLKKHNLIYLVCDDNHIRKVVEEKLFHRFYSTALSNGTIILENEKTEEGFNMANRFFQISDPTGQYFQLMYYPTDIDPSLVDYHQGNVPNTDHFQKGIVDSCINDFYMFPYVLNYTNTLINKQLEKGNFIDYQEMVDIADEFAGTYGEAKENMKVKKK